MKNAWLNLVLHLTNRIYFRKQEIFGRTGFKVVKDVFILVFLEIFLAIASLPLYAGMKPATVVAFLEEKGGYSKVSFDYNLRRILTLTGVTIALLVWLLKLSLILFLPKLYGPMALYSVSNLRPADVFETELIATETAIQTSRIAAGLPRSELREVRKESQGGYSFSGTGPAGKTAVLLLSGIQTAVYSADIDEKGQWNISYSRKDFILGEGNHSVIVFSFDDVQKIRSEPSPEQFFKVTTTFADRIIRGVDSLANFSIIFLLAVGVFLTFLTV